MRLPGRRLVLEIVGWALVVLGIAALVLPGPGLLILLGGLVLLSQQYEWARRHLEPVRRSARRAAEQGVRTWPRIVCSVLGAIAFAGLGVVWGLRPPAPGWWPLAETWWLPGGWGVATSLIVSAVIALGLIGWSIREFRGRRAS